VSDDRDHLNRQLKTLELCGLYRRTIKLTCPGCQRVRLLDAVALWWLAEQRRWPDEVREVARKLYCEDCHRDRRKVVRPRFEITREPPSGPQFAYPDEREWKRVVARFRS
jgi:hypothetical protein